MVDTEITVYIFWINEEVNYFGIMHYIDKYI